MDCEPKRNCGCCQNSICEFLQSLEPFTQVESIVIAGNEIDVSYFLSFNKRKGIVSFVQESIFHEIVTQMFPHMQSLKYLYKICVGDIFAQVIWFKRGAPSSQTNY